MILDTPFPRLPDLERDLPRDEHDRPVHPAILDVASMSSFFLMMGDLISVLNESGAQLDQDFIRYLITRHDPNDAPQSGLWR